MPKQKVCPLCGTFNSIIKHGSTKNNIQRYKCKSCLRTFILDDSTTSKLQNSDYIFKKFIGFMIDDVTLDVIARNLNISFKTALYYRYLVFESLRNYQEEVILKGTVLIDETFVRINDKRYKFYRADGKGIRGISFNHLCVVTVINLYGKCIAKVASRGMVKPDVYIELCINHMENIKLIIHDGGPTQKRLMKRFDCPNVDARRDQSGEYNTKLIDSLHSNIKRYLYKHAGYRLKNLQHYLNFFVYRYNHTLKAKYTTITQRISNKEVMNDDLYKRVKRIKKKITYRNFQSDLGITDILESVKS
jgi:transposase-like protein